MSRYIDGGILIVVLTAFLFTLSVANYNGYLAAIGIEPSLIIRSSHQILYNALFIILTPLLTVAVLGIVACFTLYLIADVYTDILRKWIWLKKKIVKLRLKSRKKLQSRAEMNFRKLITSIFPVALVTLVFFGSLMKSEKIGRQTGYDLIEKIQKSDYLPHEVIKFKGYESKIYVVSCGINNCGGINVDTMKIEYFENKFSIGAVANSVNIKRD